MRHSDFSGLQRMRELGVAAFLMSFAPSCGFEEFDDLVAGHDRTIHTNTHEYTPIVLTGVRSAGGHLERQTRELARLSGG